MRRAGVRRDAALAQQVRFRPVFPRDFYRVEGTMPILGHPLRMPPSAGPGTRQNGIQVGRTGLDPLPPWQAPGPRAQPCGQARWMCPPSEGRWSADDNVMSMDPGELPMTSLGRRSASFPLICTVAGAFSWRRAKKKARSGAIFGSVASQHHL